MKRLIAAAAAAIILAGCATTATPTAEAEKAPVDRLLAYQDKKPATTSTIVITRDSGILGSGCYYAVQINGTVAARLGVGETSNFYVEPGDVLLGVGRDPDGGGICSLGNGNWTKRETVLRPNEVKLFRLTINGAGEPDIQRGD